MPGNGPLCKQIQLLPVHNVCFTASLMLRTQLQHHLLMRLPLSIAQATSPQPPPQPQSLPPTPPSPPLPGQQRAELIGSLDYSARQRKFQSEQELLHGQEDVTAALRRTRQLMLQNVEQQHGNLSVLGGCGGGRLRGAWDEGRRVGW